MVLVAVPPWVISRGRGRLGELLAHGVHAVEHDDDRIQSVDSLLGILGGVAGSRGIKLQGVHSREVFPAS